MDLSTYLFVDVDGLQFVVEVDCAGNLTNLLLRRWKEWSFSVSDHDIRLRLDRPSIDRTKIILFQEHLFSFEEVRMVMKLIHSFQCGFG